MGAIFLVRGAGSKFEAETLAMEHNIHDTLVGDGWEAGLLLDVVGNILEIHLNARGSNHDLILVLAANLTTAKAVVIVIAKLEDVREEVVTLNDQVLDDSINHRIGNFDTWDGDISSVLEDTRDDHIDKIFDQVRLECGLAIVVGTEIVEELLHRIGKSLVLWVLVELVTKEFELVHDAVGVVPVALAEQEVSLVVESVPLLCGFILENIALLL